MEGVGGSGKLWECGGFREALESLKALERLWRGSGKALERLCRGSVEALERLRRLWRGSGEALVRLTVVACI
jgi:hypothetical protein